MMALTGLPHAPLLTNAGSAWWKSKLPFQSTPVLLVPCLRQSLALINADIQW